jgi:tetratricopeptide (TPR) repeat protein
MSGAMNPNEILDHALQLGEEQRWEEMARMLSEAQRALPEDDPYLLCWLGVAERELGNDGAAYDAFRRCVAAEPLDPHVLALAGAGLAWFDDPDAESVLRAAALTGPDVPVARLQYGSYLAREGLFDDALEHLRAALALAPDDPVMHEELGNALALKGDLEAAAGNFETGLEMAPDDSWTRVLLGLVHAELGNVLAAAEALTRAAAERPDDGEAQIVAALAAAAAGWDDAAQDALARALHSEERPDAALLEEAEERVAEGADAARRLLFETLGPSILHDRLGQPL